MKSENLPAFFEGLEQWARGRDVTAELVTYGEHHDQMIELRRGSTPGLQPLAIVLHGGFWRAGYTRANTTALAVALAESGWSSGNVEYRRLGPGAYRAMLDDVAAARRSLEGFSPVIALGHSAGGHLAVWLGAEGLVDACVALGGVCNLAEAAQAELGERAVQELLGGSPDEVPEAYEVADPGARLPLGVPQVLVHGVGDDRVPLSHAHAYAARARAAGDDCRVVEVAAGHFEPIDPRSRVWPDVLGAMESARSAVTGAAVPGAAP
jgi:acetyl esterase/lipase